MDGKIKVAHLSGPTATIQNSPPLVTSDKARRAHGLPPRASADGTPLRYDALRPQRLAAPALVYVEQFSAHPLESDAAALYGPPDGFVGSDGAFSPSRRSEADTPVYAVELRPEDGLYALPYMALQADGGAWEEECVAPGAPESKARQAFYPDGARVFEEIDRFSVDASGVAGAISSIADMRFFRVLPPAGYAQGRPRDDGGAALAPERRGRDFFPYRPRHLSATPPRPALAKATNDVQSIVSSGEFDGAIWTQGSPNVEDTAYWLNLLIDSRIPIVCSAAQRPHGHTSDDGAQNLIDALVYMRSRVWADDAGANRLGVVLLQDQQIFAAREVAKADARPGGYVATGGHGGVLGQVSHVGRAVVTYLPATKHTHASELALTRLPNQVEAVRRGPHGIERATITVKDDQGRLLEGAVPSVSIVKDGGYCALGWEQDEEAEADLIALIEHKLGLGLLSGLVVEGTAPTGNMTSTARQGLIMRAVFSGLPVVRVARGSHEAFADPHPYLIAGSNLTATKARFLLMAALMKLGSLPCARDPKKPGEAERAATRSAVLAYQALFDTH